MTQAQPQGGPKPKLTLIDLAGRAQELDAAIEALGDAPEDAELQEMLTAYFNDNAEAIQEKLNGYVGLLKRLHATATMHKAEAQTQNDLCKYNANRADRLKAYLMLYMSMKDVKRLEVAKGRVTLCENGGNLPLHISLPSEKLPTKYRRRVVVYEADTEAIRKALMQGVRVRGCSLGSRGNHLLIK